MTERQKDFLAPQFFQIIVAVAEEHDLDFYALYTRYKPNLRSLI